MNFQKAARQQLMAAVFALLMLGGCSGSGSGGNTAGVDQPDLKCSGGCANAQTLLTRADVERAIAQGVAEAQAHNIDATIAVVDRVGNVLAVYRMGPRGARTVTIVSRPGISGGLEGIRLPTAVVDANLDGLAAIAKAITGAYLSSEGNAFSTRTASQIVQEHFNPGEQDQPAGPLFGVQFSQLACSDFSQRFAGAGLVAGPMAGPKRSPLGLSADPGGLPLYKGGTVVGGVGVLADGLYSADIDIQDRDQDLDELIAVAASYGFGAPPDRRAERITVDGKSFRYLDAEVADLLSDPDVAPGFSSIAPSVGELIPVRGYFDSPVALKGTAFGTAASGIRPDLEGEYPAALNAFVFVDSTNTPRFPPIAGTEVAGPAFTPLAQSEVRALLSSALGVARRARAQIRRPLNSSARVTISVVDTQGEILGMVRGRDAPIFGADVSLQKARGAAAFSSGTVGQFLSGLPDAAYIETSDVAPGIRVTRTIRLSDYATRLDQFLAGSGIPGSGQVAFSDRGVGNLSRPFFPDGLDGQPEGPLSKPPGEWSVFSTGLQLDLPFNAITNHVVFAATDDTGPPDIAVGCAGVAADGTPTIPGDHRLANAFQLFAGSVPIYRGDVLVGGIGVSGDGIDQDDMVAFLGVHNASVTLAGAINNAPTEIRSDQLTPRNVRLRYVQCPQAPFLDSDEQQPCSGK